MSPWWISPLRLRRLGVLGMNRRNAAYIEPYNARAHHALVNNKLLTKQAALKVGIPTPALLGAIDSLAEIGGLMERLRALSDFVIKPAHGSGGKGIVVVVERTEGGFLRPGGKRLSELDLQRHLRDILNGRYSLGGKPDLAMAEQRVEFAPFFADYSHGGVPDVRVVVFRGVPVMAMLRCSTRRSGGRANLHQGAVAVGLDMASGRSVRAVQHNRITKRHPDTRCSFEGLQVPDWEAVLALAARCYEVAQLGYIGCDIVFDREGGPMLLELNARPGLAIQLANGGGLRARLEVVERLEAEPDRWRIAERVAFSRRAFGRSMDRPRR